MRMKGTFASTMIDPQISGILKYDTKSIDDKGKATIVSEAESQKTILNGTEVPFDKSASAVFTFFCEDDGKVAKATAENAPPGFDALVPLVGMLRNFPVPVKPVKVGDKWRLRSTILSRRTRSRK